MLVFTLVFVPALIAGLDALQITSIPGRATDMLAMVMHAIPNIFAAVLILLGTWSVVRFAYGLLGRLWANVGADSLPAKMGVGPVFTDGLTPSVLTPRIMVFFAMLCATVEAAYRLDFTPVEHLVAVFVNFGGKVCVNMAFTLVFGAVAVAVALSFGLGGRDAAGRQMEHWLSELRKD